MSCGEPDAGELARPVRRAAAEKPAAQRLTRRSAADPYRSTLCCSIDSTRSYSSTLQLRQVYLAGITANPTGEWATQQARNIIETFVDHTEPIRFLIHDRDSKFTAAFDEVLGGLIYEYKAAA